MAGRVVKIERVQPRDGIPEVPHHTSSGYQMAPATGRTKHHAEHAIFAADLDEVARLIAEGCSLWMKRPGKRPSLIAPVSLRVIRI